jgi:hypothetical protein
MNRYRIVKVYAVEIEAETSDEAWDIMSKRETHLQANWDNIYDFDRIDEKGNILEMD